ncbi:hypothetical protein ACFX1Q_014687 [Malus domestica]
MTLNGGSTFDLNLVPGVGEDGDNVSVSRRKASEDRGCVSGCDLATDDDHFELEAIIEAVMNENKGKKRSVREVEYDEVNPCVEPKRSKLSRESYVEAEETSLDNLLEQNRLHTPDIVVLLETKNKSSRYGYLKKRLDLEYMHVVEPKNIGGGLCVFWRDASQVTLVKSEDFVIEVKIWDEHKKCHWYLFAIYASTDEKKRRDQWGYLRRRLGNNRGMTLLIGDFNDILCNDEKEGATTDRRLVCETLESLWLKMSSWTWVLLAIRLRGGTTKRRSLFSSAWTGVWLQWVGRTFTLGTQSGTWFWKGRIMLCYFCPRRK